MYMNFDINSDEKHYRIKPLRKQAAYKQPNSGPAALSPFWLTIGNEDKLPYPRALLPLPADSNWGPHGWESMVFSTEPQQLLE